MEALIRRIGRAAGPQRSRLLPPTRSSPTCSRAPRREGVGLIHQPGATADALERYLKTHPEYDPGSCGERRFLTTGAPGPQNGIVSAFWGETVVFEGA